MDRQLRDARNNPLPGWEWLADLPAQATHQVLLHYLRAWDRFYKGVAGRPKFKQRSARMAVDNPQACDLRITRLNRRWGEVTILKVGRVRFRWTRPLPGISPHCPGRITGARLVKNPLGWHIALRIVEPISAPLNTGPPIGLDRGVVHTIALSNGEMLDMPPLLSQGEQRRLLGLQRKASRQQAAYRRRLARDPNALMSRRQWNTQQQIAVLRAREVRRREDWLHNNTTNLVKSHGLIVVEDLRIKNMTRSASGTVWQPGRNVRAKSGLNRSILGMAWGKAERMLAYKCDRHGSMLLKVDARNSSKQCARCGNVSGANRIGQATFHCLACGRQANADTNAAQVVLQRGLTALSGVTPGLGGIAREAPATVPHREPLACHAQSYASHEQAKGPRL